MVAFAFAMLLPPVVTIPSVDSKVNTKVYFRPWKARAHNFSIFVPGELLEDIDEFRFKNKFQSRAEAIKWLLLFALKKDPRRGQLSGVPR